MTALGVSDINLGTNVASAVHSQINRSSPLLAFLDKRPGFNGGGPVWNAVGSGATVRGHADDADFTTETHDDIIRLTLPWVNKDQTIKIGDHAAASAKMSGNPRALENLFAFYMMQSIGALSKQLEQEIVSGDGDSNSITGLRFAIGGTGDDSEGGEDSTVGYAGQSGALHTYWNSVVDHPTGTLSKKKLRKFFYDIRDSGGVYPNIAVCTGDVFAEVAALYEDQVRYPQGAEATMLGESADLTMTVGGVRFIVVDKADGYDAGNSIWAFNNQHVFLEFRDLGEDPAVIPFGNLPMGIQVVRAAKTGHWKKAITRVSCQLVIEKRSACGKMVDITVT